jgi:hypothetical protein
MIDYIKNIIPRIQQYSEALDSIENFVDKNWIFLDENNDHHEYLFLRDKRIIMTLKYVTKEGSWDLLPTGQLLIKRSSTDIIKLEKLFIEKGLLILKYSSTSDNPFVLINTKLIPDLDVVSYLKKLESEYERLGNYILTENDDRKIDESILFYIAIAIIVVSVIFYLILLIKN